MPGDQDQDEAQDDAQPVREPATRAAADYAEPADSPQPAPRAAAASAGAKHRRLVAVLAAVAGYTDAALLLYCGVMATHVTGPTTHAAAALSPDPVHPGLVPAWVFACIVIGFFLGCLASAAVTAAPERTRGTKRPVLRRNRAGFVVVLLVEALLLCVSLAMTLRYAPGEVDASAWRALLVVVPAAVGMGMQNALVTRVSGTVVRTTHLSGMVTDLGIALADLATRWRQDIKEFQEIIEKKPNAKRRFRRLRRLLKIHPSARRALLFVAILSSFAAGAVLGTLAYDLAPRFALAVPVAALPIVAVCARPTDD